MLELPEGDKELPYRISRLTYHDGDTSLCQRRSGTILVRIFSTSANQCLGKFVVDLEDLLMNFKL